MPALAPRSVPIAVLAFLAACAAEAPTTPDRFATEPAFHSFAGSAWSAPVNLGAPINSACGETGPSLSSDGLALYFGSSRPGGFGVVNPADPNGCQTFNDIYVSRRDCLDCAWETPVNLGPAINSAVNEGNPSPSNDGHLLFFISARPGGPGSADIYLSHRVNTHDDLGWGAPVALGVGANSAQFEAGPEYLENAEDGRGNLYFSRGPTGNNQDIWYAAVTREGESLGPATRVDELSTAEHEAAPSLRGDGREIIYWAFRAATGDPGDLYASTRRSVNHPWSAPVNLGPTVNSPLQDRQPSLSSDGRTLLFASFRAGSLGEDIWMATRSPAPDRD